MNNFKTGKKFLALVMALLIAFSGISVYASETENNDYEAAVCHEHLYGDWIIKDGDHPTCQSEGKRYRECKNCTDGVEVEILPADPNAHVPGSEKVIKSATCTSAGLSEYTCINEGCNVTYQVETSKLGHSLKKDANGNVIVEVSIAPKHMFKHYENGKGYSTCTRCGVSVDQIIYVEHDFSGATPDNVKKATCKEDGYKETKCNICEYSIRETLPADPDAHVFSGKAQLKEGEVFDCKNDGVGVAICEKCNATAEITVPKEKYHDYLEWKIDVALPENPTCGEYGDRGAEVKICDVCFKEVDRRIIYAPHNFTEIIDGKEISYVTGKVASTCCTRGYEVGNCVDCGQKDVKNYFDVDADAHNYKEKVTKQGSCTVKGEILRLCTYDASHFEYVEVEIVDHVYAVEWEIKEATCSEEGYKKNYCLTCNETIIEILPKDEDAHDFSGRDWTVTAKATCGKTGLAEAGCKDCGRLISKTLPLCYSDGANFNTVDPTCYKEGVQSYICKVCGQGREIAIPKDDSVHVAAPGYRISKAATCSEAGIQTKYCTFCNADLLENQKVIPAKAHTVKEIIDEYPQCAVNADESKLGKKHHECLNCDYKSENEIDIAPEHNFTSWENKGTPDCVYPITRERVCYGCGLIETENDIYGDHVEVQWTFPAGSGLTCITGGTAEKKCTACGKVYDKKTIAAGDHTELVFVTDTIEITNTECYGNVYKCVTCNEEVVVSRPHSFILIQKGYEPTCTKPGLTDSRYCSICKLKQEQTELPALGHDKDYDSNGTEYCKRCNLYTVSGAFVDSCDHFCHNQGIVARVLKMLSGFFWKLFKTSHFCKCGVAHYHEESTTIEFKEINKKGKLVCEYSCLECEVENKEITL